MTAAPVFRDGLSPRVVLIEDVEIEREAIASHLTQLGYRVEQARDGLAGMKILTANPPDIVILDMDMPRMGGIEVLRRMRAAPEMRSVYVIVTSGLVGARDRQRAFEEGCNQYIVKPFSLVSLAAAIHTYFWKVGVVVSPL